MGAHAHNEANVGAHAHTMKQMWVIAAQAMKQIKVLAEQIKKTIFGTCCTDNKENVGILLLFVLYRQ